MTRNVNRVPKKQWAKWSAVARRVFNGVYRFIANNPDLMSHPKAARPHPFHWKTVSWNAAWLAADAVDDSIATEVVTLTRRGHEIARKKVA